MTTGIEEGVERSPWSSTLCAGWVRHRRYRPRTRRFRYRIAMPLLDLDEVPLLEAAGVLGRRRFSPLRFDPDDYGHPDERRADRSLADSVRDLVEARLGVRPAGRVLMLAHVRTWGWCFNPLTVHWCHDEDDAVLAAVLEVTNTPWGERQSYVLECDPGQRIQRIEFGKQMHVSPFNPMGMRYRWRSNDPARILALNLDAEFENRVHVDATLALKRREINSRSLAAVLLRFPWMTGRVVFAIYWQALKLRLKRTPIYDHPVGDGDNTISRLNTKT